MTRRGGYMGCCFGDAGDDRVALFEAIEAGPGLFGLGDVISTEGDCKEGEVAVGQMLTLFEKLGRPARFAAGVDQIKKALDEAEGRWTRHLPFTTVCGEIKAFGKQADELSKRMADAAGAEIAGGVSTQDKSGLASELLSGALWVAGLVAGSLVLREATKLAPHLKRKGR